MLRQHVLDRFAPADPLADRAVAAVGAVAGRHDVADAGEAVKRLGPGAQVNAEPGDLDQPAGQEGRLAVIADRRARRRSPRRSPGYS